MAAKLMQQGSKGAMRDLDYINPRPPKQSCALPAEVRAKLGLDKGSRQARSSSEPPPSIYVGAANAEAKVGKSGAGTNWRNPNGHAFVRKGSGVSMSQRASRKAQLAGIGAQLIQQQSQIGDSSGGDSDSRPSSRDHPRTRLLRPRPPPIPSKQPGGYAKDPSLPGIGQGYANSAPRKGSRSLSADRSALAPGTL